MTQEGWNGVDLFMNGEEPDEWLHFVSHKGLDSLNMHSEAVEKVEAYRLAYMDEYGESDFDLVNPETKYDLGDRF